MKMARLITLIFAMALLSCGESAREQYPKSTVDEKALDANGLIEKQKCEVLAFVLEKYRSDLYGAAKCECCVFFNHSDVSRAVRVRDLTDSAFVSKFNTLKLTSEVLKAKQNGGLLLKNGETVTTPYYCSDSTNTSLSCTFVTVHKDEMLVLVEVHPYPGVGDPVFWFLRRTLGKWHRYKEVVVWVS